jgi:uncharacterized protein DUF4375
VQRRPAQFFLNPTGVLAPEAAHGFQALGLEACAAIVREAIGFFGEPYPRDQEERCARLDAVRGATRTEWDPFHALDDRFHAALGSFDETADRYLDAP